MSYTVSGQSLLTNVAPNLALIPVPVLFFNLGGDADGEVAQNIKLQLVNKTTAAVDFGNAATGAALQNRGTNLWADPIDKAANNSGYRVTLYFADTSANAEYYVEIVAVGGVTLGSAIRLQDSDAGSDAVIQVRETMTMAVETVTLPDSNVASGTALASGDAEETAFYFHPDRWSLRGDSLGYNVCKFTVTGGVASGNAGNAPNGIKAYLQLPSDDQVDTFLAVDDPDPDTHIGYVYIKAGVTPSVFLRDYSTSLLLMSVVCVDDYGAVSEWKQTLCFRALPQMKVTLNSNKIGDYLSTPAYDDPVNDFPLAKVELNSAVAAGGADAGIGSFTWGGSSSFVIDGSVQGAGTEQSGGGYDGQVKVTFSANSRGTSEVSRYLSVGDAVKVSGGGFTDDQQTLSEVGDDYVILSGTHASDATMTLAFGNAATGVVYIALDSAVAVHNTTAYSTALGDLTYTEGDFTWSVFEHLIDAEDSSNNPVDAGHAVLSAYKFSALVAADFTVGAFDRGSADIRDDKGTDEFDIMVGDIGELNNTVTVAANKGIGAIAIASISGLGSTTALAASQTAAQGATTVFTVSNYAGAADGDTGAVTFDVTNSLSTSAAAFTDPTSTETVTVYGDIAAGGGADKVHADYLIWPTYTPTTAITTAQVYSDYGIADANSEAVLSVSSGNASSGLEVDNTNNDVDFVGNAPVSVPTSDAVVIQTADDANAAAANTVTNTSTALRYWSEPAAAWRNADDDGDQSGVRVRCVPLLGDDVDTTQWTSFTFRIAHGHTDLDLGAITVAQGTASYASASSVTVALTDATVAAEFSSGAVFIPSGDYAGLYSGSSVASTTLTLTGHADGDLTDAGSAAVEVQRRSETNRQPLQFSASGQANDLSTAEAFEYLVTVDSGTLNSTGTGNGTFRVRLKDSRSDSYATESPITFTLTWAAYDSGLNATSNTQASWSEGSIALQVGWVTPTWNLGKLDDKVASNIGWAADPTDADGSIYDYTTLFHDGTPDEGQQRLFDFQLHVDQIDVSADPFKLVAFVVDAAGTTSWGDLDLTNYTATRALTYANADASVEDADGYEFFVGATQGTEVTTASENMILASGSGAGNFTDDTNAYVSLRIDPTLVASNAKLVVVLVTQSGCTRDGSGIKDEFIRRFEVRYAGGVDSFALPRNSSLSGPGFSSFTVGSLVMYDPTTGSSISSPVASTYSWDYKIDAAVVSTNTAPAADDATEWKYRVMGPVVGGEYDQGTAGDLLTALTNLADAITVSAANAADYTAEPDISAYNATLTDLNFASSQKHFVFYRVGLRRNASSPTLTSTDSHYIYAIAQATSSSSSVATRVVHWGLPYQRSVSHEDDQTVSIRGMATQNWIQLDNVTVVDAVQAATTAALAACIYDNGAAGVGATLTGDANGALAAVDGVTLVATDRVLVKDQADAAENGVYTVTQVGDGSNKFILTRATGNDASGEQVDYGVFAESGGTVNGGLPFINTTASAPTMGTGDITWTSSRATAGATMLYQSVAYSNTVVSYDTVADNAIVSGSA